MASANAHASENSRLRQAPMGIFGGEIAAAADNPGFFGTVSLTHTNIFKVVDNNGDEQKLPAGANLSLTQQINDDKDNGVAVANNRYKNYAVGPFVTYKLPGKSSAVNLHYSRNFGSRNAIVSQSLQLRLVSAW